MVKRKLSKRKNMSKQKMGYRENIYQVRKPVYRGRERKQILCKSPALYSGALDSEFSSS